MQPTPIPDLDALTWWQRLLAQARVLARAWPAWAAAITALLGVVTTQVVPLLPENVAVRVVAVAAAITAGVAAITAAVARVTPVIDPDAVGLLPVDSRRRYPSTH